VDYKILAMLHEQVCQHPVQDVDELIEATSDCWSSINRQSLIKRLISGDLH